ncbi:hypothetical protein [Actinopolymorpha pittospori]|uniref:Uncharacterized protein n=1 Tax=Actinopolymorpha pittospori TaxID=648752 RepID=A0A927N3R6_9ACTN|nr:hypothetical protein [Actinopolymorpha pittospori]MBE1611197.1 hypothetical protein [Actinopolymorpha pittospori]
MTISTDTLTPPAKTARRPRASLWALRITAILHSLLIFLQPVLAGEYLAGDLNAIANHETNAHMVTAAAFAQLVAAVFYGWRGRGRWWPVLLAVGLELAEETQKIFGYSQNLLVHIPLGVTLIATQVLFTVWLFGPRARQARARRERRR